MRKVMIGFIQILICLLLATTYPLNSIAGSGSANYSYLNDSDLIRTHWLTGNSEWEIFVFSMTLHRKKIRYILWQSE